MPKFGKQLTDFYRDINFNHQGPKKEFPTHEFKDCITRNICDILKFKQNYVKIIDLKLFISTDIL